MEKKLKAINLINGTDSSSFINLSLPEISTKIANYIADFGLFFFQLRFCSWKIKHRISENIMQYGIHTQQKMCCLPVHLHVLSFIRMMQLLFNARESMIFLIATCIKAKVIQQPLLIKFEHQPWEKLVTDLSTTICDDVPTSSVLHT